MDGRSLVTRRGALMAMASMAAFSVPRASRCEQISDPLQAPFGLTWGMPSGDVGTMGAALTKADTKNFGASFSVSGLPKTLSDVDYILLSFGYRDQLFRIVAVSKSFGPDPYGNAVAARYVELAETLAERYGKGREIDRRDTQVWKMPSEYVMSLHQGRALRFTTYSTAATSVEISIRAPSGDQAIYIIIFESVGGKRLFETDKKAHEKEAL